MALKEMSGDIIKAAPQTLKVEEVQPLPICAEDTGVKVVELYELDGEHHKSIISVQRANLTKLLKLLQIDETTSKKLSDTLPHMLAGLQTCNKVKAFQSSDGKHFFTESDCDAHEQQLKQKPKVAMKVVE